MMHDLDIASNYATIRNYIDHLPDTVSLAVFPDYAITAFLGDERLAKTALSHGNSIVDSL